MSTPSYFAPAPFQQQTLAADLCIYGGVSGGVIAAIEAAHRGLKVVLVEPSRHLGGLTAGGLGMTDVGNKHVIGGLSREFYCRAGRHYGVKEEWRFEPHVAEQTFEDWLAETSVQIFKGHFIQSVTKEKERLVSLTTGSGLTVTAAMFIDATYEGDLMARAGVTYTVGRESNSRYNETLNGAQIHTEHQFNSPVDPYVIPGKPGSGLLPGIDADSSYELGRGDRRVQAYNFRMCLTDRPDLRIPFSKPAAYNPQWYVLLKRHLATGWNEAFRKFDPIRNGKTDTNNHGAVSTDFIGQNHSYPEADYETREKIFQAHVTWQQGLMWTLANDPEIPTAIREPMSKWGLCRDEFTESGGWPHALYVRESRRMVSDYVMTEHDCRGSRVAPDSVGMAAYGMDSHNIRRIVVEGRVVNEGDVQAGGFLPYPVSYRSIIPAAGECENLLVPYCLSASHIGFGSIRMEPVFMGLGQSAAVAASIALAGKTSVQAVPYATLKRELEATGQILRRPAEVSAFKVGETEADPVATH
jgi:hypothetical protein